MRVVLDSRLQTPLSAKLVQTAQQDLWIFCGPGAAADRRSSLEAAGVKLTCVNSVRGHNTQSLDPAEILAHLHAAKLTSVLVEAGSAINAAFLRADLVDEAILFYAETELGPAALPFALGTDGPFALEQRMLSVTKRTFGSDVCVSGLLHDPWSGTGVI